MEYLRRPLPHQSKIISIEHIAFNVFLIDLQHAVIVVKITENSNIHEKNRENVENINDCLYIFCILGNTVEKNKNNGKRKKTVHFKIFLSKGYCVFHNLV